MRSTAFVLLCTMGFVLYLANRIDNRLQLMEHHLMEKIQGVRSAITEMTRTENVHDIDNDVGVEEEEVVGTGRMDE